MAATNVWRVRFAYEKGNVPFEYGGQHERIVDVVSGINSEGRPTLATVIASLTSNGYGVPAPAPTGTVLAVRNIAPASCPAAIGTVAAGQNQIWRVKWHYEKSGVFLQQ